MKDKIKIIALLFVVGLGLVVIPYAAMADDSKTKSLANEYVNLGVVSSYTVDAAVKVPKATVNAINIARGETKVTGTAISKPGDYTVQIDCEDDTYSYEIFCYRRGDANVDGVRNVKDLVAAYKTEAHPETSAKSGADMDGSQAVRRPFRRQLLPSLRAIALKMLSVRLYLWVATAIHLHASQVALLRRIMEIFLLI